VDLEGKHRWSTRIAIAAIGLCWMVITYRVWLLGETFYLRDFWVNCVPARWLLRESLARGELFLWNPWIGGGLPALPDANNGVLYLPGWPFLVFKNQAWAQSLSVDVHLLVAAAGTYLVARRSASAWGALAAAVSFAFGGLMMSNRVNLQFHLAYCCAPFWFYFCLRLLDRISTRDSVLASASALAGVWALQLVASDPQLVYLEGLAFIGLLCARQIDGKLSWPVLARGLGVIGLVGILAIAIGSPVFWAMLEALGQSARANLSDADSEVWSFHPRRFWEQVVPLPWGDLAPLTTFWGGSLVRGPWKNFYFASTYCTALALPLSLFGVSKLRRKAIIPAILIALLLVASLGMATPVHRLLRAVFPLWHLFRYPERSLFLPTFGLAVLIGCGIDRIAGLSRRWSALLGLPCLVAVLIWWVPELLGQIPDHPSARLSIERACLHAASIGALATLVALRGGVEWRQIGLALVVCLDLVLISPRLGATWTPPSQDKQVLPENGRVLFLIQDITGALSSLPPEPAVRRAFEDSLNRPNLNAMRGVRATNGVSSLDLTRTRMLIEALGVEQGALKLTTQRIVGAADLKLKLFEEVSSIGHGVSLYRFPGALPEVSCLTDWKTAIDSRASVRLVRSGDAVVEGSAPPHSDGADASGREEGNVPCVLQRVSPTQLNVDLEQHSIPVLIQISESYYPGWKMHFRGNRVAAMPVDLALLGGVIPPGVTHVEFHYRPGWLTPLLGLSALSVLILLFGICGGECRRFFPFACHPAEDRIS